MSSEVTTEIIPGDCTATSGILVLLPPICCLTLELEGRKLDIVLRPNIVALKKFVHVTEPIVRIKRLFTVGEGLGLIFEELCWGYNPVVRPA